MKRMQWIGILGIFLLAPQAHADSITTFVLYGKAPPNIDVEVLWKGEVMAESDVENGRFELDVPMGKDLPYHKGDKLEIGINSKPTGHMVVLGKGGSSRKISLPRLK